MNLLRRVVILVVFILLLCTIGYAQQRKDSTRVGEVVGIARDSIHNYVLNLATAALYKTKDSSLISYQLCNNFGEFHFKEIPVGVPLRIIVSYTGYKSAVKDFVISEKLKKIDLKILALEMNSQMLQEVLIKGIPPVRMNGDTLEFNASAFDLDKNAVAEDLLRKLPGVTVWGDGSVTVNGKQVNQVLVNGKPFFGGETRVATQNIPKNAIDKIQVYREASDKNDPLDSNTNINIKLKKGKDIGYFGKLATGYATDKKYESDANINFFNKMTQLGIVGASNNVNKIADNASVLLSNSTFKGVGTNIDYQPNFILKGINKPNLGGFIFQHDFIAGPSYNNTSRLAINDFITDNRYTLDNSSETTTLNADGSLTQRNSSLNNTNKVGNNLKAVYTKRKRGMTIDASTNFKTNQINSKLIDHVSTYDATAVLKSTNNTNDESVLNNKNLTVDLTFTKEKDFTKMNLLPGNWDIHYSMEAGYDHAEKKVGSQFISIINPSQNQSFDRQYNETNNDLRQNLFVELGTLSSVVFGRRGFLGVSLKLRNSVDVDVHKENNLVNNLDTTASNYLIDKYLTNNSKVIVINEKPSLMIGRTFIKTLSNRYSKLLSLDFLIQEQIYHQNNNSDHAFQRFTKNYERFIPTASVTYLNDQYGDFTDNYTLSFSKISDFPTVNQLYPIVDSANQYYIHLGNPNLKSTTEMQISFSITHKSERMKNTFNYNVNASAGFIRNSFADSTIIDDLGRSKDYTVNVSDKKYLNISGTLNKAFKFKNHQLQLQFSPFFSFSRNPNYINNLMNISNIISNNNSLSLNYTLGDWWAISMKESFLLYSSKQIGSINNQFNNVTQSTAFSTSLIISKRLSIASNVAYNRATSSNPSPLIFTIWNANATYRMLSGNNLEIKIAALDLLHQNTGIINEGSINSITRGTTNVLQQYFMLSIAYYPRQFGRKETKSKNDAREE